MTLRTVATRLPSDLTETLDAVCRRQGLRKNFVLEAALREKIEDLLDAEDLREAVRDASGFHSWASVKQEARRGRRA